MNLLGLPQEVLVHILLQLDVPSLLSCGQVCHYCKTLLELSALQYKFALARSGMVDGPGTGVPVNDRLAALERYGQAWHAATPIQDPQLPTTRPQSYRCLPFSGGAIPFISGHELKLYLPASPARRVRSKVWSYDLQDIPLDPVYCTIDLSQDLFVLCGKKATATNISECHILSLSKAVIVSKEDADIPILTVVTSVREDDENSKVTICGDLLAWTWADDTTHLRVYNWKSGQVVWACNHDYPIYFAFLGQRCLAVAQHCADHLRVYNIDPDTPSPTLPAGNELPDGPDMRIFLLPPTEDVYDCYALIQGLASDEPSGSADRGTLFMPDAKATVLVIVMSTASSQPYSNIVWRPGGQDYIIVVPTRALLAHIGPPSTSQSCQPIASDHPSPIHDPISWQSWGQPCSRLLPITARLRWISSGLHVVGSRCLIVSGRPQSEAVLDVFVCDFHPFAEDSPTDGEDQDRATAHLYMDTSNVLTNVETLKGPIRNRLPFRVVHKVVKYDPAIMYQWGQLSTALLEDGVVVMINGYSDRSRGIMHLLCV